MEIGARGMERNGGVEGHVMQQLTLISSSGGSSFCWRFSFATASSSACTSALASACSCSCAWLMEDTYAEVMAHWQSAIRRKNARLMADRGHLHGE